MTSAKEFITYQEIEEAAAYILDQTDYRPKIGMILGSGLSPLAEEIEAANAIAYEDIPNFPVSGVPGHAGRLVIGNLAGNSVSVMQGRTHFYEGLPLQQITLPVRAMRLMGIETLIVTNAAGGINPTFQAGDLMLITDHINMIGLSGHNPLRGPNIEPLGPRFPNMTHAYSPALVSLAQKVAQEKGLTVREGVYACVAGPSFETPAEIRFLKIIGADAVGMSTAPEVTVASHAGMQVLGVSSITNVTVKTVNADIETTHEEVLETGKIIVPKLIALLKGVLEKLGSSSFTPV